MPKGTSYIQPAQKSSWETPKDLFDALWEEADGFDCDPCCTPEQYTARRIMEHGTPVANGLDYKGVICIPPPGDGMEYHIDVPLRERVLIDGLAQPWHGKVFMNPPYGLALRKWVPRAVEMVKTGAAESVWALLPAKTDTQWFQAHVVPRLLEAPGEVRFLKGRLTFGGAPDPAGFASVVVVWR